MNSLHPAPIETCRPLARAISSAKSALCFLCYLLFKPSRLRPALCALCVVLWQSGLAEVHYVDLNSTNATPPYANWATAATNIQDAVDAAVAGDEIIVTNGTYAPVTVLKPIAVRSVSGPQFTTINGGRTNRCMYLTANTSLSGFTLANGSAGGVFCQSASAVVSNCTITGNYGGSGAYGGTLNNCRLCNNGIAVLRGAATGGGAAFCTLNNCVLMGNSAIGGISSYSGYAYGGGAYACTLNNCALTGNSAYGVGSTGRGLGGGAYGSTLNSCTLTGNSANGTNVFGGGASYCTLTNCIAYFNSGANYDLSCTLNYCCTTPLPASGVGNISSDPQLASASHLSAFSPCIGKGYYPAVSGTDIDGEPWANPPSIGCDEYHAGTVTGPLSVAISASFSSVAVGFPLDLTALIDGPTDLSIWDFGDGALEINQPYTAHSSAAPGDYLVSLWAFNDSQPGGISATVTVHVVSGVHYVAASSTNPVAPYASWATAAPNIQTAVNVATVPGALVLVTNGTYGPISVFNSAAVRSVNGPQSTTINGGGSGRCVYLAGRASLSGFTLANGRSLEGGGGAYGGTLTNCILAGNSAPGHWYWYYCSDPPIGYNACPEYAPGLGGGAAYCTLNNCSLIGNSADEGDEGSGTAGGFGGGAAYCTLNNCTLIGNWAYTTVSGQFIVAVISGGGAAYSTLNNCTLIGNGASATVGGNDVGAIISGGGAYVCTLRNCALFQNVLQFRFTSGTGSWPVIYDGPDYDSSCTANNCWTNDPLFVSGSLRLQSNSPCINAGNNAYAPAGPDLDGNPRIAGGTVDIGAYEFQAPVSQISYAWLQQYGLPMNSSTDTADPDGDAVDNYHEWLAGTNPTNALSSPAQLTIIHSGGLPSGIILTWSTNAVGFTLQSTTNLLSPAAWVTNSPAPVVIAGLNTVTNLITGAQRFYRLIQ